MMTFGWNATGWWKFATGVRMDLVQGPQRLAFLQASGYSTDISLHLHVSFRTLTTTLELTG